MKMFRQKSYDVLKGPSLQLLFWEAQIMVQVMLCPSTKTTLSMHLGPMLCQELWKRWTGAVHLPSLGLLSAYMS
jgi:hypothetical protein